jgi:hypothetical protein
MCTALMATRTVAYSLIDLKINYIRIRINPARIAIAKNPIPNTWYSLISFIYYIKILFSLLSHWIGSNSSLLDSGKIYLVWLKPLKQTVTIGAIKLL